MMNNFRIFIAVLILLSGCLAGPDTSRINKNDPDSYFFFPKFSDLKAQISNTEKNISIYWIDRSNFNNGFLVKRRFSLDKIFEPIDTISTASYSRILTDYSLGIEYQITSYFIQNDEIRLGQSLQTDSLYFGNLTNLGYFSQNDTVFIQWFRNTAFDDRITIEYKEQNTAQWTIISTIKQGEITEQFHRTNFVLPTSKTYGFRVEMALKNFKNEFETFYRREFTLFYR